MFYITDEKSIKILVPIKLSNQENKSRATGRIHVISSSLRLIVGNLEILCYFIVHRST